MKTIKNKQIRSGVFECNSSSTNSFTLSFNPSKEPEFKPIVSGPIKVYPSTQTSDCWQYKLADLAAYSRIKDKPLEYLVDTIKEFCGEVVKFDFSKFDEYNTEKWGPLTVESYFEDFRESGYNDEYGNTMEDIESQMDDILSTKEKTLAFLFSTGHIEENEWYDG